MDQLELNGHMKSDWSRLPPCLDLSSAVDSGLFIEIDENASEELID